MVFNKQQNKILQECYDFVENFKFPAEKEQAMKATAEYALKMETIKTLEGIKVAYNNSKK